MEDLKNIYSSY